MEQTSAQYRDGCTKRQYTSDCKHWCTGLVYVNSWVTALTDGNQVRVWRDHQSVVEQRPWEAVGRSQKPSSHYRAHKSPPLHPILRRMNPSSTLQSYYFIFIPQKLVLQEISSIEYDRLKFYTFLIPSMRAKYSCQLALLDIILIIFCQEHKLSPTSCYLICLRLQSSSQRQICFSFEGRHKVSSHTSVFYERSTQRGRSCCSRMMRCRTSHFLHFQNDAAWIRTHLSAQSLSRAGDSFSVCQEVTLKSKQYDPIL
jgi:hypothetical protein